MSNRTNQHITTHYIIKRCFKANTWRKL